MDVFLVIKDDNGTLSIVSTFTNSIDADSCAEYLTLTKGSNTTIYIVSANKYG